MSAPAENPFAGQGSVLLDIGGEIGALVVTMPVEMEGVEVEIRPVHALPHHGHDHGGTHHPHVAVVNRPVKGGQLPSLVFPELVEGGYALYLKESDDRELTVTVVGGRVATAVWPG
jgi:hypothetical protein